MEATASEEITKTLDECIASLNTLEGSFVKECHLSEPRKSLQAFAKEHNLRPREMADLRVRAIEQLREELAAKNIHRLTDII